MGTMLMRSILYFVLHPYLLCMGAPGGPISTTGVPILTSPGEFYEAASAGEASIIQDALEHKSGNIQTHTRLTSFVCNSILNLVLHTLCMGNPVPTTPREFYEAVSTGEASIIQGALATGSNNSNLLNWRNKEYLGYSALHIATEKDHGPVVRLLLEAGANPNMKDDRGNTPLYLAAREGHTTVLRIMLEPEFKADVNLQEDTLATTPVYVAAQNGKTAALELLVAHGADVNKVSSDGTSPLARASWKGHAAVVKILVDAGANIGFKQPISRHTALHIAVAKNYPDIVRILLQNGADTGKQNNYGDTPADLARRFGLDELKSILDNY